MKGSVATRTVQDDDCCRLIQPQRVAPKTKQNLIQELERRIRARHAQLKGYEHDEREHLLEAKRLLKENKRDAAASSVKLALEARAIHARETAKYANLVSLRNMLQEAKRNLTMAELLQQCSAEMQTTLARMPDVIALRQQWEEQRDRVTDDQAVLLEPLVDGQRMSDSELEDQTVRIADEQILEELERLVVPTTVPAPAQAAKSKVAPLEV